MKCNIYESWPPQHIDDKIGNAQRRQLAASEPRSQRTRTPSLAMIARSQGVYHWTTDGRRLFDFTSGVLVTNLGHNPPQWRQRFQELLGWTSADGAVPFNVYNAATPLELEANRRLLALLRSTPFGQRLERIFWAASGSEAVHKALWAALKRDVKRDVVLATRHGFHGKKGLANAVTGCETDEERDPRVHFIDFPRDECRDVSQRSAPFDPSHYRTQLVELVERFRDRIACVITEPYLGGGGSFHPPQGYLRLLQEFCRENHAFFILDEVQSNFGRTGRNFAFEKYELEPDMVILGKSMGNGVPVAAVAGRADIFDSLKFGELSDTWSANPLSAAAVLAALPDYEDPQLLDNVRHVSPILENGLEALRELPMIRHIRGESGGMVWGVETGDHDGRKSQEWALRFVEAAYRGNGDSGVHLLGPLAGNVIRIAPPLVITSDEAVAAGKLLADSFRTTLKTI